MNPHISLVLKTRINCLGEVCCCKDCNVASSWLILFDNLSFFAFPSLTSCKSPCSFGSPLVLLIYLWGTLTKENKHKLLPNNNLHGYVRAQSDSQKQRKRERRDFGSNLHGPNPKTIWGWKGEKKREVRNSRNLYYEQGQYLQGCVEVYHWNGMVQSILCFFCIKYHFVCMVVTCSL